MAIIHAMKATIDAAVRNGKLALLTADEVREMLERVRR